MDPKPELVLASGSPRRRAILAGAGVSFEVLEPVIDDALLPVDGGDPQRMVLALAWFKARQVAASLAPRPGGPRWLLAADTMCFRDGVPLGKPADGREAASMIASFAGRSHEVVTGMCMLDRASGRRHLVADRARVALGALGERELADYVASGEWRGKAGGYNYADRLAAGWPLGCEGDPETVMGLPSRLVLPILRGGVAA